MLTSLPKKRCPSDLRPDLTPTNSIGTTSVSNNATIHLIGRINWNLLVPHFIIVGKFMSATTSIKLDKTSVTGFPVTCLLTNT